MQQAVTIFHCRLLEWSRAYPPAPFDGTVPATVALVIAPWEMHIQFPSPIPRIMHRCLVVSSLAFAVASGATATAQRPVRVYISVDMEGIAGVVTADQLLPAGFEYAKARE